MNVPFASVQLDNVLQACIEFTNDHDQYFHAANIAGRPNVETDPEVVKRMMEWIVELDNEVLEYKGFGNDNLEYFRLGLNARKVLADGGFSRYLLRKRVVERLEHVKEWSPIVISLFALVVSALAWQAPKSSFERIDELSTQLVELKARHEETQGTIAAMQKKLQTNMLPNNRVQPTRKKAARG